MKKLRPVQKAPTPEYPSAEEAGITRRGVLRLVIGGGAAALGSVLLEDPAEARRLRGVKPRPRFQLALKLAPAYRFRGCKSAIVEVLAMTHSRDVDKFMKDAKEQAGIQRAVRRALRGFKCSDLKGRRRAVVGAAVGKALTDRYRARRKRRWGDVRWVRLKES